MHKENNTSRPLTEVWGDTVDLRELAAASLLGIILTMSLYLLGSRFFLSMDTIAQDLAKGYSLMVGITGCILSGAISAKLFKPKRKVEEKFEAENIEDVIRAAGMTLAEEIEALKVADPQIIKELEDLELYALLALIPEDSPNYNPVYQQKAERSKQ